MPGGDAASQKTLNGSPVEAAESPGVHVKSPRPAEEEELLSRCLCGDIGVVGPGQHQLLCLVTVEMEIVVCDNS